MGFRQFLAARQLLKAREGTWFDELTCPHCGAALGDLLRMMGGDAAARRVTGDAPQATAGRQEPPATAAPRSSGPVSERAREGEPPPLPAVPRYAGGHVAPASGRPLTPGPATHSAPNSFRGGAAD